MEMHVGRSIAAARSADCCRSSRWRFPCKCVRCAWKRVSSYLLGLPSRITQGCGSPQYPIVTNASLYPIDIESFDRYGSWEDRHRGSASDVRSSSREYTQAATTRAYRVSECLVPGQICDSVGHEKDKNFEGIYF